MMKVSQRRFNWIMNFLVDVLTVSVGFLFLWYALGVHAFAAMLSVFIVWRSGRS